MKLKFFFFSFFVFTNLNAQEFLYSNQSVKEKTSKDFVSVIGSSETFSSGLNFDLLSRINRGGEVSETEKVKDISKLYTLNRFESISRYGVSLQLTPIKKLKEKNLAITFNVSQRTILGGSFSKNLAELIAYGNEPYLGKNLDLSNSKFFQINFQQAGLGIKKEMKIGDLEFTVGVNANYLNAKSGRHLQLVSSNLFTDSLGFEVEGNLNGSYSKFPAESKPGLFFVNKGNGVSGDLNFYLAKENKWSFAGGLNDFGAIKIYQTAKVNVDTTFSFKGIYLDTYRLLYDTSYIASGDSLTRLLKFDESSAQSIKLPYFVYFNFSKTLLKEKFTLHTGLTYRNNFLNLPSLQLGFSFNKTKIIPRLDAVVFAGKNITYRLGGFYKFQDILSIEIQAFAPHFIFYRNSNSFGGSLVLNYFIK
jgi:hypothetical protein